MNSLCARNHTYSRGYVVLRACSSARHESCSTAQIWNTFNWSFLWVSSFLAWRESKLEFLSRRICNPPILFAKGAGLSFFEGRIVLLLIRLKLTFRCGVIMLNCWRFFCVDLQISLLWRESRNMALNQDPVFPPYHCWFLSGFDLLTMVSSALAAFPLCKSSVSCSERKNLAVWGWMMFCANLSFRPFVLWKNFLE